MIHHRMQCLLLDSLDYHPVVPSSSYLAELQRYSPMYVKRSGGDANNGGRCTPHSKERKLGDFDITSSISPRQSQKVFTN